MEELVRRVLSSNDTELLDFGANLKVLKEAWVAEVEKRGLLKREADDADIEVPVQDCSWLFKGQPDARISVKDHVSREPDNPACDNQGGDSNQGGSSRTTEEGGRVKNCNDDMTAAKGKAKASLDQQPPIPITRTDTGCHGSKSASTRDDAWDASEALVAEIMAAEIQALHDRATAMDLDGQTASLTWLEDHQDFIGASGRARTIRAAADMRLPTAGPSRSAGRNIHSRTVEVYEHVSDLEAKAAQGFDSSGNALELLDIAESSLETAEILYEFNTAAAYVEYVRAFEITVNIIPLHKDVESRCMNQASWFEQINKQLYGMKDRFEVLRDAIVLNNRENGTSPTGSYGRTRNAPRSSPTASPSKSRRDNALGSPHATGKSGEKFGGSQCVSCADSFPSLQISELECGHRYCLPCLKTFVYHGVQEHDLAVLPPRCCNRPVCMPVIETVLSRRELEAYREAILEKDTPDKVYCANSRCGKFIPPRDIVAGEARCRHCNRQTCSHCRNPSHPEGCPSDTQYQATIQLGQAMNWKRCPSCRMMVGMDHGCNHMTSAKPLPLRVNRRTY